MSEPQAETSTSPEAALEAHFDDARAEAIKAVEAAVAEEEGEKPAEGEDGEAPETQPEPKTDPAKPKKPREEEEPPPAAAKSKIAQKLRERERARTEYEQAQRIRQESEHLHRQLQQERQQIAQERAWLQDLRKDPLKAIKATDWDPENLIVDLAKANTHEGQLARTLREQQAQLQAQEERWRHAEEERKQAHIANQRAEALRARTDAERDFLEAGVEDALESFFPKARDRSVARRSLILLGHEVADEYRAATGGRDPTAAQVAEYVLEQLGVDAKQVKGVTNGKGRPGGKAVGSRSLTNQAASERRSVPKPASEMDDDERHKAAIAAADRAIRESAA